MPGTLARLRLGPFVAVLSLALGVQVSSQAAPPPAASRCVLLFFDDLHMAFRDTPRVRDAAKRLIRRAMQPGDLLGGKLSHLDGRLTYLRQWVVYDDGRIADSEDSLLADDSSVFIDLKPPRPAERQSPIPHPMITRDACRPDN